jgi:L-asparaginase II
MDDILAKEYRGKTVESLHFGAIAVVDSKGKLIYSFGDPYFVVYLRSAAKPFQAIPLITSGAVEEFGFSRKEIAIICGSHNGQEKHIEVVKSILKKTGLSEKYLQCGTHIPHYYTINNIPLPKGAKFRPIHNNCSGKHAGILALSVYHGWNTKNYLSPKHPAQKMILDAVSEICEYSKRKIGIGVDGCGVPVFAMPLYNMALGFSKLITHRDKDEDTSKAYQLIASSMLKYPEMVSGFGRFDLALAKVGKGNILSKAGVALICLGLLDRGWGMAAKIVDGARIAIGPVVCEALRQLGVLKKSDMKKFGEYALPIIRNHKQDKVGFVTAEFRLKRRK